MPKFTFICDHNDEDGPGPKVTFETNRVTLDDVLFDLQDFLKGCGYVFDGELSIVNMEEIYDEINAELSFAAEQEREAKIYESPDHGKTVFSRSFGTTEKEHVR